MRSLLKSAALAAVLAVSLCGCANQEQSSAASGASAGSSQTEGTTSAVSASEKTAEVQNTEEQKSETPENTEAPAASTAEAAETTVSAAQTSPTEEAPAGDPVITIGFAEETLSGEYVEFTAEESEYQTKVSISADRPLKDFTLLSLTLEDVDDSGKMLFSTQPLFITEELEKGYQFIAGIAFYGDLPSYGFSYTADDGTVRSFAIEMSGEDGSLYIREI